MIRCYTTEHGISRMVMSAFAEGCGGRIVPADVLLEGEAATYGILRGTETILKKCQQRGIPYHYIDHGYIGFSHSGGYYRIARNGRQSVIDPDYQWPSERFDKLKVNLKPWRRNGKSILVIPVTGPVADFYGIAPDKWLGDVVTQLSHHTDRPIYTKKKESGDILEALNDCWCVVTHSSNVAVDALIEGVPAITLGESIANPLSWSYADIEKPHWPERGNWVRGVACHQWTLNEMRRGEYMRFHLEPRRAVA